MHTLILAHLAHLISNMQPIYQLTRTKPTPLLIQTVINILNLNITYQNSQPSLNMPIKPPTVPQARVNSPATMESNQEQLNDFLGNLNTLVETNTPPILNNTSWQPPPNSNLQWTWIEGNGPFITNGKNFNP